MEYGKKTENLGKWETSTWRLEKWRSHWKTWKMRNSLFRTWNIEKTENHGKWETSTWWHKKWRNHWKREKWEMHTVGPEIQQEKGNQGNWEIQTFGREIVRGKLEKVEILEMSTVGHGICQENWKSWKMRNNHLITWKMTKSLKNVENEKCTR